jgi:hypothetical protein
MKCVPLNGANATHHGLLPSFSPHLLKPNSHLMDGDHHVSLPRIEFLLLPRHIAPVSRLRNSTTERTSQMKVLLQTRSIREVYSEVVMANFEPSLASFPIWRLSNACGRHVKERASLLQMKLAHSRFRGLLNFATKVLMDGKRVEDDGLPESRRHARIVRGILSGSTVQFSHVTDRVPLSHNMMSKLVVNLTFPPFLCDKNP